LFKNACSAGSTPPIGKIVFSGQALLREEREARELIQIVKTTSAALLEVKTALLEQTAAIKLLIEKLK
jgi:hypothetical protein